MRLEELLLLPEFPRCKLLRLDGLCEAAKLEFGGGPGGWGGVHEPVSTSMAGFVWIDEMIMFIALTHLSRRELESFKFPASASRSSVRLPSRVCIEKQECSLWALSAFRCFWNTLEP